MTSQLNLWKFSEVSIALVRRGMTRKMFYLAGFYINLRTIHLFDLFVKYLNSTKQAAAGKKLPVGFQSAALAISLKPKLWFEAKYTLLF